MALKATETPSSPAPSAPPAVRLSLRTVGLVLLFSTALVALACIVAAVFRVGFGYQHGLINIIPIFDMYEEGTLPAWYSSTLLLLSALLLVVIAGIKRTRGDDFVGYWFGLAALFLLLSIDESASLHERLSWPMRHIVDAKGVYFYAWVIPGTIGSLVVALIYLKFLLHLPARTRNWILLAGAMFLGGALGMEMLEGLYESRHGRQTAAFETMVLIEEILEMAGVAVFVYGLADYLRAQTRGVTLELTDTAQAAATSSHEAPSRRKDPVPLDGLRSTTPTARAASH